MNNEPLVMSVDEWAQDTEQLAAGNRNVRKLPAACSGKSQRAKLPKVIVN